MRARWESLHAALIRSVSTLPATVQYQALRRREPIFTRFESAEELLAHLARELGDLDEKDQIYAALVRAVQRRGPSATVASALVWCGLWPGLDRICRRRLRYFERDPDELPQAISLAFTALMDRIELDRVRRVAATLVRSTDRVVMERRRRVLGKLTHVADDLAATTVEELASELEANDPTSGLSLAGEIADLRRQLLPVVGVDADLVLAVFVLDVDQREAAARLGLAYAVARKRLQRALLRIRAHLEPEADPTRSLQSPDLLVNSSVPDPDEDSD